MALLPRAPEGRSYPLVVCGFDRIVSRTKDGTQVRYSISGPSVFELCGQVCGGVRRHLQDLEAILQPV